MSSIPDLGPTQPPIQLVPEVLSPGIKGPGREADHSPPTSAGVKKIWIYTSTPTPPTPSWCSAELIKHKDNFNLCALGYLHRVNVDDVTKVSEIYAASFFKVGVYTLVSFSVYMAPCFERTV
jgi:hypothetical protein